MKYSLFQDFARPATQAAPSQFVHRNLATGPK